MTFTGAPLDWAIFFLSAIAFGAFLLYWGVEVGSHWQ